MGALHNGGFLFARDKSGYFAPVIVNARISDIMAATIPFAVSHAATEKDLADLKAYILDVLERVCQLREKDIKESGHDLAAIAAVIAEAENAQGGKTPENVIPMPDAAPEKTDT